MENNHIDKMASKAIFIMFMTAFGLGLNYFFGIFVARKLGVEEFGLFALSLAVFNIVSVTLVLGLDNAVLRFSAKVKEEKNEVNAYFSAITFIGLFCSIVSSIILYICAEHVASNFLNTHEVGGLLKVFALGLPAFVLLTLIVSLFQSRHDVKIRMVVRYLLEPICKFLIVVVMMYLGYKVVGVVLGSIIALWICALVALTIVFAKLKISYTSFDFNTLSVILAYCLPIALMVAISVAASKSGVIFLGSYFAVNEVAYYAAAFQTATILNIILQSMESVAAPVVSEQIQSASHDELENCYKSTNRWTILLGTPLFLIFILQANDLMYIYGPEFMQASVVFIIIVVAQFVNIISGSGNIVLLMGGFSNLALKNGFYYAVLLISANYFLIPIYGLYGAAVSVLFSTIVVNVIRIYQVWNAYKIIPFEWYQLKPIISGGLILVFFIFNERLHIEISWYYLTLLIVVSYFVFIAVLGIKKEDIVILEKVYRRVFSS